MEREESNNKINIDAKLMLKRKNYILKAKRITVVEIDEIMENIRRKIWNDREDHTKGMNGNTLITNIHSTRRKMKKLTILA